MTGGLVFTASARETLAALKKSRHLEKRYKAVTKALRYLAQNPKHPSLQTHKFTSLKGPYRHNTSSLANHSDKIPLKLTGSGYLKLIEQIVIIDIEFYKDLSIFKPKITK